MLSHAARPALGLVLVAVASTSPVLADQRARCAALAVFSSPAEPIGGETARIVVAGDEGSADDVAVVDPAGRPLDRDRVVHDGSPWSVITTITRAVPGTYRVTRAGDACGSVVVTDAFGRMKPERSGAGAWPTRLEWSRSTETLWAAWIEHLFAAPADAELSFPSLEPLLRDPSRNFLYDHLGLGEDSGPRALAATPDCADLPYLLRAYFAWKLGLPFGYRQCGRDTADRPPRCSELLTNEDRVEDGDALGVFGRFARRVMDTVHSGSARTALDDDATDFYPVALRREAIRPGTIYADPYGHTLIAVGWVPQTAGRPGFLLAVDAQPDNTVARKRFWEGTFLFVHVPTAGPGFKTFRPVVHDEPGGRLRALSDDDLAHDPRFTPWSDEQERVDPDTFYARMSALANPAGLAPERAYDATLDALVEQLETRVRSVQNGEDYMRAHPGTVVEMPEGPAIFETTGAWEDYATPSRDFRLIIAMKVLEGLPARIVRHPELFLLENRPRDAARADVETLHAERVKERAIEYTRSDGSTWRITVADALARKTAFETAYDPNDCIEVRWGAPEGSAERESCRRRAPEDQARRMEEYREWFRESRRPTR